MNHSKPIIFCEEFLCNDLTKPKNSVAPNIKNVTHEVKKPPEGICYNCENSSICMLHINKKHILHCEEYQ